MANLKITKEALRECRYLFPYWSGIRISHCPFIEFGCCLQITINFLIGSVSKCFNWRNTLPWLAWKNCNLEKELGQHIPLLSGGNYTYRCWGKGNLARLSNGHGLNKPESVVGWDLQPTSLLFQWLTCELTCPLLLASVIS